MMKFRRSERLIDMTNFLLNHPRQLVPLTVFADRYGSAKSSISEDLAIIKEVFEERGIGTLQTVAGAAGGVKYQVQVSMDEARSFISELCETDIRPRSITARRIFVFNRYIRRPTIVQKVGAMIASAYIDTPIDVVMTIATKGIPLAYGVAKYLNVPVVIVRNDNIVTEGSLLISTMYRVQQNGFKRWYFRKEVLAEGSNVLIIDDFMKAGGTVNGMISLLDEFQAQLAGIAVLVEAEKAEERLVEDYLSLIKLSDVDLKQKQIRVTKGNFFTK